MRTKFLGYCLQKAKIIFYNPFPSLVSHSYPTSHTHSLYFHLLSHNLPFSLLAPFFVLTSIIFNLSVSLSLSLSHTHTHTHIWNGCKVPFQMVFALCWIIYFEWNGCNSISNGICTIFGNHISYQIKWNEINQPNIRLITYFKWNLNRINQT